MREEQYCGICKMLEDERMTFSIKVDKYGKIWYSVNKQR